MKKIFLKLTLVLVVVGTTFSFKSCNPEDEGAGVAEAAAVAAETTAADALGAWTAYQQVGSCAINIYGSILAGVFAGVMGGIASHNYAIAHKVNGTMINYNSTFNQNYVNPNNPYECAGKIHNSIALSIVQKPENKRNEYIDKLQNFDQETYDNLYLNESTCIDPELNIVASTPAACRSNLSLIPEPYKNTPISNLLNNAPANNTVKNYFINKYTLMVADDFLNKTKDYKLNALKNEIDNVLNDSTINPEDKKEIVVFLTVLKYSTSFWGN